MLYDGRVIAICGPIAERGVPASGGYEAANQRLHRAICNRGWSCVLFAYPSVKNLNAFLKSVSYAAFFMRMFCALRKLPLGSVLHFTPLCRQFILPELLIALFARKRCSRIIIDLRAGRKDVDFRRFGCFYQFIFRRLIDFADVVTVEGRRYIQFIHDLRPSVPVHYLPNFLNDDELPIELVQRSRGPVHFTYVGSVNFAKGVDHAIKLVAGVAAQNIEVRLDLFGPIDPKIKSRLEALASKYDWIVLHGARPFEVIRASLANADFFIFLTAWKGEGHSNALTEAMSQGAIPIVTDHGFNKDVVGALGILVEERDFLEGAVHKAASLIRDINTRSRQSAALLNRTTQKFSESAITKTLEQIYFK